MLVFSAISALLKLRQEDRFSALKADVDALVAKLKPELPAKSDGTPWTDADVHAGAAAALAVWSEVQARADDATR
jgi:hypothetical protein